MSDSSSLEYLRKRKQELEQAAKEKAEREQLARDIALLEKQAKPKNKLVKGLGLIGKGLKAIDQGVIKVTSQMQEEPEKKTRKSREKK